MAQTSGLFQNTATQSALEPIATAQPSGQATELKNAASWQYQNDPVYQNTMNANQSQFNLSRANAQYDLMQRQLQSNKALEQLGTNAQESRRRLAGNYAARGMAGGLQGARFMAEARLNAEQVANQTDLKTQMSLLNESFLSQYGATGSDWQGTLLGQQYKTSAINEALKAQLARKGL